MILAVVLLVLSFDPASVRVNADAADLFISEYIEGSSNNKAIEIYNGTGAAIDLSAAGYNIQIYFNGSASAGLTINLTGNVASGDVFVLAHSSASAAILAQADQTDGAAWFNGDDAVVLRRGSTILDVAGQVGFDPGTEWGSGLNSTADNTLRRDPSICGGDTVPSDAFDPATGWIGLAADTFDGLGAHTANCEGEDAAPAVSSTFPANGATDFPAGCQPDRDLQRAGQCQQRLVPADLSSERGQGTRRERRTEHLHDRSGHRSRAWRELHAHRDCGERHRSGCE